MMVSGAAQPAPLGTQRGITLIELLVTTAISLLIMAGLSNIVGVSLQTKTALREHTELTRQASFAMQRMVQAVSQSRRLLLPLADNPATNWREHVREQTVPASPPEGSSTNATAVLAVTLPLYSDLNFDAIPDADNDGDGRIDEDPSGDVTNDLVSGIVGVDDDGDGSVDEPHGSAGPSEDDDDEDGIANEDAWNALDDDGDGMTDEDPNKDMNGDALAGLAGVDDDGDATVDEGDQNDDDEDGLVNEDWLDAVVFRLQGADLIERWPVPWDANQDSFITGADFIESVIAANITRLRFERLPQAAGTAALIDITLELTGPGGQTVSLTQRTRVGGAL